MDPKDKDADSNAFNLLLERLDPDPIKAAEKFLRLQERLREYCSKRGEFSRADELVDKTLHTLAKKVSLENIRNPEAYAFAILRNYLLHPSRPTRSLPEDLPAPGNTPEIELMEKFDGSRRVNCYVQCVRRLMSLRDRQSFLRYFTNEDCDSEKLRRQLAIQNDITPAALRARMCRLREKVEACCHECYRRKS